MASSMLAAIRAAVFARADDEIPEDDPTGETGAEASTNQQETEMSAEQRPAAAGISQQEHDDAVRAAEARGAENERARIRAATGAEGVSGDGNRFMAAVDLALRSTTMAGADVAAFVVANVAKSSVAVAADTQAMHDSRVAAAGLAQPSTPVAPGADSMAGWKKAAASANARFGERGI